MLLVLQVWGVIFCFTFQVQLCGRLVIHADVTRKSFLSPLPPPLPPLLLSLCPNSQAEVFFFLPDLFWWQPLPHIVCYFFNTYIMYFIWIRCHFLSVPIHPVPVPVRACVCVWSEALWTPHEPPACIVLSLLPPSSSLCWDFNYPAVVLWCRHDIWWWIHYLRRWRDDAVAARPLFHAVSFASALWNLFHFRL